jgi:PEGA domain
MCTLKSFQTGWCVMIVGVILLVSTGCVERRFVVQTNVPGAQIFVNNQPVGPSPADQHWDYTGVYEFRAVAPGYDPLLQRVNIRPKWYEYPGIDLFFEVLYPFHIEDVRRLNLELQPSQIVRTDELLERANSLREQGQNLPAPKYPDQAKPKRDPLLPK